MSSKRFELISVCGDYGVKDTLKDDVLFFGTSDEAMKVVDLLNSLLKKNEQLKKEKMLANAFIVEKRLEVEFVRWCKEDE